MFMQTKIVPLVTIDAKLVNRYQFLMNDKFPGVLKTRLNNNAGRNIKST
jgi:hypothetical protein